MELKQKISAILGTSSDWCSCYEGDIGDVFPTQVAAVTEKIAALVGDKKITVKLIPGKHYEARLGAMVGMGPGPSAAVGDLVMQNLSYFGIEVVEG